MTPTKHVCTAQEDELFCYAVLGDKDNKIYSNLTRQFPVRSYEGMCYIFVAYYYKLNTIMLHPMKNREDASMITAFKSVLPNQLPQDRKSVV